MSDRPLRRLASVRLLAAPAVAALIGLLSGALTPLSGLDDWWNATALGLIAKQSPARHTAVLRLSAADATATTCATELAELLRRGQARGGALIWPATTVCPLNKGGASGHPPLTELPPSAVRSTSSGVVGLAAATPQLEQLGVRPARWIRTSPPAMVPSVALADLRAGRLDPKVLQDRVVVVALTGESDAEGATGRALPSEGRGSPSYAAGVAAALDGAIAGDAREQIPWWLSGLLGGLLAAALAVAYQRQRRTMLWLWLLGAGVLLLVSQLGAAALLSEALLPLASLLGGTALALAVMVVSVGQKGRWLVGRAGELSEHARSLNLQGLTAPNDEDFFRRVHSLAEQCFPASFVLLAKLPPKSWHLQLLSFGEATEGVVSEPRRDVRRPPYCDEQGAHTARVIRGFLVMKDMPVVAVPLLGPSDLEGFVFYCGEQAEAAHLGNPDQAARVGRELGGLLHHERLAQAERDRQPAAAANGGELSHLAALARTAEAAIAEVELLSLVLQETEAGLLYTDSFGAVRRVSKAAAKRLEALGIALPSSPSGPLIPAGSLSLAQLIKDASTLDSERIAAWLAELMAKPAGATLELGPVGSHDGQPLCLHARALRRNVGGAEVIVGYVVTLSARAEGRTRTVPRAAFEPRGDALAVFPLALAAADVARAAARHAGRPVRSGTIRSQVHAIAHRHTLLQALEIFLIDAATMGSKPVVNVREKGGRAELVIMDLNLSTPLQLLERAIEAPIAPPKGLESLAGLAQAVYDSHGELGLRGHGFGVQLAIRLLPAHPVLGSPDGNQLEIPQADELGSGPRHSYLAPRGTASHNAA